MWAGGYGADEIKLLISSWLMLAAMEICPSIIIIIITLIILVLLFPGNSPALLLKGHQTKRSVAFTRNNTTSGCIPHEWIVRMMSCSINDDSPPRVGCLQRRPLLYISSWIDGHILSAEMVTTVALSASISFPTHTLTAIYHGPCRCYLHQTEEAKKELFTFFVI